MKEKYQHSGKVPPLGVVLGVLLGIVSSIPLAFLYNYGIVNVPYIKLRMIFALLFGFLVGLTAGWGLTLGKVRNNVAAALLGSGISVGALYVSWGAWLLEVIDKPYSNIFTLLERPGVVWQLILLVNAHGTWSMGGSNSTGIELWVIWGFEALMVILCGLGGALMMMNRLPFCENCDRWCTKAGQFLIAATMAPSDLVAKVNQGQFEFLQNASVVGAKQPHYTFAWHSCSACGSLNTLTVSQVLPKNNKVLVNQLLLSGTETELLRNRQMLSGALSAAANGK